LLLHLCVAGHFDRVDNSGVFVSNWARNVQVLQNQFSFTGSAGVIVMGHCELIDCTSGTHPQRAPARLTAKPRVDARGASSLSVYDNSFGQPLI
jgi:hypothetical protein